MWWKAGAEFITNNSIKKWGSHPHGNIDHRWGEGRKLGHGDYLLLPWSSQDGGFWCSLCLCQHDLPEPSVVVVGRYTNIACVPWGSSCFLYLDISTLSRGASSTQFPLNWLLLCRLLPYSDTKVVLPQEEDEEVGLKVFPYFWKALWQSSEEEHHLSDPIRLSPSPQRLAKYHPGQIPAGMWISPRDTVVGSKIQWLADQVDQEAWEMASTNGQRGRCHLSWGLFSGELNWLDQGVALVLLLHSAGHHLATGRGFSSDHCCSWARGLTGSAPLRQSTSPNLNSASSSTSLIRYPLCWHSPDRVSICLVHCQPHKDKAGPFFQQLNWWSLQQKDPCCLPKGKG